MVDPVANPAPSLDYTAELPEKMTPTKLISIYSKIWQLQTEAGLKMVKQSPQTPKLEVQLALDKLFEGHRVEAYEATMEMQLSLKSAAQMTMVKAYMTYASDP